MPDKITLRTIHTDTYPWACELSINNRTKSLRIVIDELDQATDEPIRPRYDAVEISLVDAMGDPRIANAAQAVYTQLRRIALVMLQDHVDKRNAKKPVDPDESGVTIDAKEERDGQ